MPDNLVKPLAAGLIDALVVQDPMKMGYLGVKTVVAQSRASASNGGSTPASASSRERTWSYPRSKSC